MVLENKAKDTENDTNSHTGRAHGCEQCGRKFKTKSHLKAHTLIHSGVRSFSCTKCDMKFKTKGQLVGHCIRHTEYRPFQCASCPKSFKSKKLLRSHVLHLHNCDEKRFKSLECPREFALKSQLTVHSGSHNRKICPECGIKPFNLKQHLVTHSKISNHMCNICNYAAGSKPLLEIHMRSHTGETPFPCASCPKTFTTKSKLGQHYKTHDKHWKKPVFNCGDCGRIFYMKSSLKFHIFNCHREKQFKCPLCPKAFGLNRRLIPHVRTHTNEGIKECPECGCRTRNLKAHIITHTKKSDHMCTVCNYAAKSRYGLMVHKRFHTGEKPYGCAHENCLGRFHTKQALQAHTRRRHGNVGEKVHKCQFCEYSSVTRHDVRIHLRSVHTNERPFKCPMCTQSFKLNHHLTSHMSTSHTLEKPFSCDVCKKLFPTATYLREHVKVNHNNTRRIYRCDTCGNEFKTKLSLTIHMRVHTGETPFGCSICHLSFTSAKRLARHVQGHTQEKPFLCSVCSKAFKYSESLKRHVQGVHEETPVELKCDVCGKVFQHSTYLKAHAPIHDKLFPCFICELSFLGKRLLAKHVAGHAKKKCFCCSKCGLTLMGCKKASIAHQATRKCIEASSNPLTPKFIRICLTRV